MRTLAFGPEVSAAVARAASAGVEAGASAGAGAAAAAEWLAAAVASRSISVTGTESSVPSARVRYAVLPRRTQGCFSVTTVPPLRTTTSARVRPAAATKSAAATAEPL